MKGEIVVCGQIIEVGRASLTENEVVIEIKTDQHVRVVGVSDAVAKFLAGNLYETVSLTFNIW